MDYLAEALQDTLSWETIEDMQYSPYYGYVLRRGIAEDLRRLGVPQTEELSELGNRVPPSADTHLVPARILMELPIAIHGAGVVLRDVYIGAFPTREEFSRLCPDNPDKEEGKARLIWSTLQAAYGQLRSVSFGAEHGQRHPRDAHLRAS
jgi:hypothetical protein